MTLKGRSHGRLVLYCSMIGEMQQQNHQSMQQLPCTWQRQHELVHVADAYVKVVYSCISWTAVSVDAASSNEVLPQQRCIPSSLLY